MIWKKEDPIPTKSPAFIARLGYFQKQFAKEADLQIYPFVVNQYHAVALSFSSLVDSQRIRDECIIPLSELKGLPQMDKVLQIPLSVNPMRISADNDVLLQHLVSGYTIVLFDHQDQAIAMQISNSNSRPVQESTNEYVERGPRDSFTENWQVNLGLVRRRMKSTAFQTRQFTIGTYTQTTCVLMYVTGIAPDDLVDDVLQRMANIKLDALIDSGQLEMVLEDNHYTPFEQLKNTERPDIIATEILRGRMAILVDGSPTALILPTTLLDLMSSPGEQYERSIVGIMRKGLRISGLFVSAYASSIYLSLVCFHPHLIPVKLVQILVYKRLQVPFPAWFEIFIMQIVIDLIFEAIMRLPQRLGQIVGVAGAIVLGQAVISVNLISPAVIIVVALSTVAGYGQPLISTSFSIAGLRYFNLLFAAVVGVFGVFVSLLFWMIHLVQLNPYHTPYLKPLSPFNWKELWNSIIHYKAPWVATRGRSKEGGQNG
jgi:hypothetical protein